MTCNGMSQIWVWPERRGFAGLQANLESRLWGWNVKSCRVVRKGRQSSVLSRPEMQNARSKGVNGSFRVTQALPALHIFLCLMQVEWMIKVFNCNSHREEWCGGSGDAVICSHPDLVQVGGGRETGGLDESSWFWCHHWREAQEGLRIVLAFKDHPFCSWKQITILCELSKW